MFVRNVHSVNHPADRPGRQAPESARLVGCSRARQCAKDDADDRICETDNQRAKPRMTPRCILPRGGMSYFSNVHVAPAIPSLRPSDSSSTLVKFSFPFASCHLYLPGFASFEAKGPFSSVNSISSFVTL